ncbi:MAG: hypothetical protein MMC33_008035 [Icmadophila ericetorum]|nr:hypothetical protein [Icmadophila ericetorum]
MSRLSDFLFNHRLSWRAGLLMTVELLTATAFILAFITLFAGSNRSGLQNNPILTFDTSGVCGQVEKYLRDQIGSQVFDYSPSCSIADWYEVHYLSVCKGDWTNNNSATPSYIKNFSTISCTSQTGGYIFNLAETLAAGVAPAAQTLFANWQYAVLETSVSLGLLGSTIGQLGTSLIAYGVGFFTLTKIETNNHSLRALRIGFINSIASLILSTISSAKITAFAGNLMDERRVTSGINFLVWREKGFYILTWMTTGLTWVALFVAVIFSFAIRDVIERRGSIKLASRSGSTQEGGIQSETAAEEGRVEDQIVSPDRDVSPRPI